MIVRWNVATLLSPEGSRKHDRRSGGRHQRCGVAGHGVKVTLTLYVTMQSLEVLVWAESFLSWAGENSAGAGGGGGEAGSGRAIGGLY